MKVLTRFFLVLLLLISTKIFAQHPPFYDEIQNFKKQDSIHPPQQGIILFVGSSSFRKWTDVQQYFPAYPLINRGFGGSTLPDVIRYAKDIIFPYHPKQIIIYCGDNDFASSDTVTAQTVFSRFKTLYYLIQSNMPRVNIVYVAIKPSPSREKLMPKMEDANKLIQDFLSTQINTSFVDVYHLMLRDGKPMPELFVEDMLHMNAKGYAIWQKAIEPYLLK
jgi:lysophospholipase L1-like esterase